MKKIFLVLVLITSFIGFISSSNHLATTTVFQKEDSVYVCMGKYAKVYHSTQNCRGLRNCKGGVIKVSYDYATKKLGRRACEICE
jgi:hypothetical protein